MDREKLTAILDQLVRSIEKGEVRIRKVLYAEVADKILDLEVQVPDSCLTTINHDDKHIKIWEFYQAPKKLQNLSRNGGDENYIAFVPYGINVPHFLEEGGRFGCCCVDRFMVPGGTILIGSHA